MLELVSLDTDYDSIESTRPSLLYMFLSRIIEAVYMDELMLPI